MQRQASRADAWKATPFPTVVGPVGEGERGGARVWSSTREVRSSNGPTGWRWSGGRGDEGEKGAQEMRQATPGGGESGDGASGRTAWRRQALGQPTSRNGGSGASHTKDTPAPLLPLPPPYDPPSASPSAWRVGRNKQATCVGT